MHHKNMLVFVAKTAIKAILPLSIVSGGNALRVTRVGCLQLVLGSLERYFGHCVLMLRWCQGTYCRLWTPALIYDSSCLPPKSDGIKSHYSMPCYMSLFLMKSLCGVIEAHLIMICIDMHPCTCVLTTVKLLIRESLSLVSFGSDRILTREVSSCAVGVLNVQYCPHNNKIECFDTIKLFFKKFWTSSLKF